tara:strand:+ start:426 stop:1913 length:1488 start_codon:yes stop_codon:yes gene_type:complete
MARNITEIVEQSKVQLDIIESNSGQIEVINPEVNSIEITFSGSSVTSDLDIITQTNTLVVDSVIDNTLVEIVPPQVTTIETTTSKNVIEIAEDQVQYLTGSVFNTINNTIVSGGNLTNVLFQTQSDISNAVLSNLVIKDFSNNVSLNVNGGKLELIFGSPSEPFFNDINIIGFDTDRFNLVNNEYVIKPIYNLNGSTFISGSLSSSLKGISNFEDGSSILINSSTHPSYASGSHNFTINILTQLVDGTLFTISSNKQVNLGKLTPTDPILNVTYNMFPLNAYNDSQNEIEFGAIGNLSWNVTPGTTITPNNSLGWLKNTPEYSLDTITLDSPSGTKVVSSISSNNIIIQPIEQYWNSGIENSPQIYHTGSTDQRSWERVKSLRYGTWTEPGPFTSIGLSQLDQWESNIGTIVYGYNTQPNIETVTLDFSPNTTTGEYLYIVYDSTLNDINVLENQLSFQNEIVAFNSPYIENGYKIYRTITKKNGANYKHKIKFA